MMNAYAPAIELEFEELDQPEVTVHLLLYHNKGLEKLTAGNEEFETSQNYRLRSLLRYKECGEALLTIKNLLSTASRYKPVTTDLGVFSSFEDYLRAYYYGEGSSVGLSRPQVYRYIRLAEHWDVVEELQLLKDKACYRLDATLRIIKWGLKKREEGYDLKELDHTLFWTEQQSVGTNKEGSITLKQAIARIDELTKLADDYKSKYEAAKRQLDQIAVAASKLRPLL